VGRPRSRRSSPSARSRAQRRLVDRLALRSSGVFLSSASPDHEQNAVGMQSVAPFVRLAEERGRGRIPRRVAARLERRAQAARRERRRVRLALDERLPENASGGLPSESKSMKASCFSAVEPVIGWNQCVKSIIVRRRL
jgi:hypothetical protein